MTALYQLGETNSVDKEIVKGVRSGMSKLLGETGCRGIIYHIEASSGLKEGDIPTNPAKFVATLMQIFAGGSKMLLLSILERLSSVDSQEDMFIQFKSALDTAAKDDSWSQASP